MYNADLNNGQGAHTSFVNGVSSDVTGGVTDNIAMCQGFYVHAKASTTLTAGENVKTNSNPTFLRPATSSKPIFRLAIHSGSSDDMTTFYFEQGGSTHFQTDYDAYKLNFSSGAYVAGEADSVITSINGLPELTSNSSVLIKAISPSTESFTFSSLQKDFPSGICVTLFDAYTGISTNILTSDYICTLYDTTSISRFTLNFYTTTTTGVSHVDQPACGSLNGVITATGNGNGPWDYVWKSGNTVIKTTLNSFVSDSLNNLNGGMYSVEIITSGGCDHFSKSFTMNQVVTPTASFSPDVFQTTLSNSGQINFVNQSSGALFNAWDFGDNSGTWFVPAPSHNYSSSGTFTVTLISESSTHCKDTMQQVISIINDITGIKTFDTQANITLATLGQGVYELNLNFTHSVNLEISLFDLKGSMLRKTELNEVSSAREPLDLESLPSGMYLLNVIADKGDSKTFKLIR